MSSAAPEQKPLIPQEIPPAHHPRVHRSTLGREVVGMDEDALASDVNVGIMEDAVSRAALLTRPVMNPQEIELALYARQRGKQIEPTKELASYLHDETKGELSDIRERLSGLTPKQRDDLEDYCQSSVPDFLLDVKEHVPDDDESKVSRFGWLGQRARGKKGQPKKERRDISWADWLGQEADDQQLLNFLQWHVAAIEKHQADPEVQAEVDAQRSAYKSGLARAIEEGWLHEGAEAAIKKVDGVRVYTGDIFDTILQDMGGYHVRGTDAIVIAAPDDLGSEGHAKTHRIKRAAKHEFNHAVLGMFGARFADEAITEHIAEALDRGEPEILDPANRKDDEHIYENERALMAAVLSQGFETVPVSLATQAYSETDSSRVPVSPFDTNTSGRDVEVSFRVKTDQPQKREMLTSRINASWRTKLGIEDLSVSVIDRIDAHVIRLEHHYGIEGMTIMEARSKAAATALSDLLQQPDVIFGTCSKLEPEQTVSLRSTSS